ncbi:MAG TPA: hypothetical protein VHB68_09940, partial [Steroidobacteraceae bacterium]|nr:hypothetical protein [Steroidobacteraceae bacterium]
TTPDQGGICKRRDASKSSAASPVELARTLELPTPGAAVAVSWSPDSRFLVAASDYGNVLSIWDRSGKRVNQLHRLGGGPTLWGSISFLQGSSQVAFPPPDAAPHSTAFSIWDVRTGNPVRQVDGPQPDYRAQHFMTSPDQLLLAVATRGGGRRKNYNANLVIYNTVTWAPTSSVDISEGISSLSVFSRGTQVVVGTTINGMIHILDMRTGASIGSILAYEPSPLGILAISAVAGSPDGDKILLGLGQTLLSQGERSESWSRSLATTQIIRVPDGVRVWSSSEPKAPIRAAAWDPKNRFAALLDNADTLYLIRSDGNTSKIQVPPRALSAAIAPDASYIAITNDHGVRVYRIK